MPNHLDALASELATFNKLLPSWTDQSNRFAVVAGELVVGFYDTYNDALSAGYSAQGLKPFLVKQVRPVDAVVNFSRDIVLTPCLTTAS